MQLFRQSIPNLTHMADPRFPLSSQTTLPSATSFDANLKPATTFDAPLRSTATAPSPGFIQEPSTMSNVPLSSSSFTSAAPLGVQSAPLGVQSTMGAAPAYASGYGTTLSSSPTLGAPLAAGTNLGVAPAAGLNAPITTTRESFPNPKEQVITKETIIPGVYREGAAMAAPVAPATSWREAPVVTNFQEKPIVTEIIEKPSLEIHRQQHITEIHERPQIVFQEQPLIVQERQAPQYRRISETVLTEDRREAPVAVANPYLGVQPHFVREAEIRNEVAEAPILKQVIEKPSVEVHQQPIVTEVIEKPAVEIHEQEVIRKFREAPTVVRSTSPVQYVSVEQARAMGIMVPPNLVEGVARMEIRETIPQQQVFVQQPQPVFIQQPELLKPATVLTEEVHTVSHPVGRAHIPAGAEIVSTTDPNLKPEVGHIHGNLPATGATTTAQPGVMGRVKNALGLSKTTNTTY